MPLLKCFVVLAVVFGLSGCLGGHRLSSTRSKHPKRIPARKTANRSRAPNAATPAELTPELMVSGTYLGTESGDPQKLLLKDEKGTTQKFLCVEGCPAFEASDSPVGKPMRVYWRNEKEQPVLYGVELL